MGLSKARHKGLSVHLFVLLMLRLLRIVPVPPALLVLRVILALAVLPVLRNYKNPGTNKLSIFLYVYVLFCSLNY